MKCDLFILQLCEFLNTGDGYYRFHEPGRFLGRLPGVAVVDCGLNHHLLPTLLDAADVLVIHDFNWDLFPLIERRRAAGRVTVQEANDNYFDIQPWNTRTAMWQNRATREELKHALAAVDAVQTSSEPLVQVWSKWARKVVVFPNQLTQPTPLPSRPARPLTIGWAGSIGHYADWYHVAPLLQKWLVVHPEVHLAVMGGEAVKSFVTIPPDRYHYRPGGSLAEYTQFLRTLDIGLAPLLPSDYNRGRSDVKFLEYAAAGVAGIYPDLEPYRNSVTDGVTGLVYRSDTELLAPLDRLAADAEFRDRIRRQAHEHVCQDRQLKDHVGTRLEFYRCLLPGKPRGYTFTDELLRHARRDGDYLQLVPGKVEQFFESVSRMPSDKEQVRRFTQILDHLPDYRPALLQLGRSLNDQKDHAGALAILERAHALDTTNATVLAEIGRARSAQGDTAGARLALEAAVTVNPDHQTAWLYLLRLLARRPGPEAEAWGEKAHKVHPEHIMMALETLKLVPPARVATLLKQLLEEYGPILNEDERIAAGVVFGSSIEKCVASQPDSPEVDQLVELACRTFPLSARLAGLHGQLLHRQDKVDAALAEMQRALDLRRGAEVQKLEFTKREAPSLESLMAEHISRLTSLQKASGAA